MVLCLVNIELEGFGRKNRALIEVPPGYLAGETEENHEIG
jgi:hypothetical protein